MTFKYLKCHLTTNYHYTVITAKFCFWFISAGLGNKSRKTTTVATTTFTAHHINKNCFFILCDNQHPLQLIRFHVMTNYDEADTRHAVATSCLYRLQWFKILKRVVLYGINLVCFSLVALWTFFSSNQF